MGVDEREGRTGQERLGKENSHEDSFMSMKKLFLAFLLTSQTIAASVKDTRQRVVFWNLFTTGASHQVITQLVQQFNETQNDYVVVKSDIPYRQLHTKMLPAIAGRVPPDVSILDRFRVASYAARGALLCLDDLIGRDGLQAEDFFAATWAECLYEGSAWAVPYDTDVRVMYYNKKLFREAGLDPENPPRTWSELRDCSRKLTVFRRDNRLEQTGYLPIYGNTGLYLYGWQKGGRFMSEDGQTVTLNDPRIVEALIWLKDFADEYGVENLLTFRSGFGADAQNPFVTGRIAMVVLDVGELSMIQRYGRDIEWATAPCPYADDGEPATWSGGFSLVIPKGAGNAEGGWAFCRFILSEASQRTIATSSNKLPALKSASKDSFFQQSDFWRLAIDQMEISHYRPVSPVGAILDTELNTAFDQVLHNKLSAQEALDIATQETQKSLERFLGEEEGTPVSWPLVAAFLGGLVGIAFLSRACLTIRRVRFMKLGKKQAIAGYLFALPAILGLALFMLGPILVALTYSFTRYEIISPATWVGVENYRRLFSEDRYFLTALWNTLYFAVFSVPINISLSLGLALLLNQPIRGRALYRTCFYLPTVMPAVAGSVLWAWLFNGDYGLINVLLSYTPLPEIPWLTSEHWSKPALIVMGMWAIGGDMIIFLAALQGVPRSLLEACDMDGAGPLRKFRHVTLPMISPAMFFMVVMGIIGSFQIFTQAYIMTAGGPVNSTLFYVLYLYREAFENLHMGYASAMAWVLFLFIMIVTGVQFVFARQWVYYEGEKG